MDVTKPYKFIGFGAMDVTKPYKFIGFGALELGILWQLPVKQPFYILVFGLVTKWR